MFSFVVVEELLGMFQVGDGEPLVFAVWVAFKVYEILISESLFAMSSDLFDFVFFFSSDQVGWR